ncbi:MAG: hypothetical protein IJP33_05765, partial [Firmicutes bacterium]|nr:hypothetical protein [Bacillota bacterium]
AEKGLEDKVHVYEPNRADITSLLQSGTCQMPCVIPYVESKYIISASFDKYTTKSETGEVHQHIIDFANSMPIMLHMHMTVLAFSIPELEEIEACLLQRYTPSRELSWKGLPEKQDTFAYTMLLDEAKKVERQGADKILAGEQRKLYQSVIHAKVERGVEIMHPYSEAQLQLDTDIQLQLAKKVKVLDATCEHFRKRKNELCNTPVQGEHEDVLKYMDYALSAIPSVRADIIQSLHIPASYATAESIKQLCTIMDKEKCSIRTVIERSEIQRKQKEQKAAQQEKAKSDRDGQIEAIRKALDLTATINSYNGTLSQLRSQQYDPKPTPPTAPRPVQAQYPEIKPQVPFWSVEVLPTLFFWPWIIIYYFTGYKKKKETEAERIRNTPEYRQQCAVLDEIARQKQHTLEEQYRQNLKVYQEDTLPKYEKALADWTVKHNKEIAELEASLDKAKKELVTHYAATKIVPEQYRTAEALRHIYEVMRSSNYTIPQAIDNYDQKIRQQIEEERLRVQQAAYEEQCRAADAAERVAADAAEARYRSESAQSSAKQDYYWSSECMQRKNFRRGQNRIFRKCEGCRMAPYCSRYK